jgi:hypothetical protein
MSNIFVQFQNHGGWNTIMVMDANSHPTTILLEMQQAQRKYPNNRIRVADENDRMIDKL